MAKNIAALLPKLTPQQRNELLSALKHFNRENYWRISLRELPLVGRDDARAAARLYGSHALASALEKWV
jgi:hypothetical protein